MGLPDGPAVVLETSRFLPVLWALPFLLLPLLWTKGFRGRVLGAAALRAAAVTLVVLAISGLSLETREPADEICIVVSADLSESMDPAAAADRDRFVSDLAEQLRPGDRLGGVGFARLAEVVAWPVAPPSAPRFDGSRIDPSGTRLAAGIEAAVPLCPESSERRILLVTDGNETLGDARRAAAFARQSGVRVHVSVPGSTRGGGFVMEKLIAPPLVREGSVFPLRMMVRNGDPLPTAGLLTLLVNGEPAADQPVRLDPGVNVFEVPWQLHERGSYRLTARLVSEAGGESHRELSLAVAGPIRALLVAEDSNPPLAKALRLRDVDVELRKPQDFPTLEDLLQYHCVIVDDVARKGFDENSLRSLSSYVENFGGGFVMTGGARSFGDKAYQKSPLEQILPVSFVEQKPKPKGRAAMGVFLLIDRSNSMSYNSSRRDVRDAEKMSYARQAALALVAQLRPEDRIGVVAFDSDPYVLGPLRPLSEHRSALEDRISRLQPGGGTDFKAALEIAASQLAGSGLNVRHIILLTDGDTNRGAADHVELISALARMGISVTTLRIGLDDVNLDFLRHISRTTGGQFYHVQDIHQLPQLIVSDAKRRSDEPTQDGEGSEAAGALELRVGEPSQILRGFDEKDLPSLRDAVDSQLKVDADLNLYAVRGGEREPLLATWQYGLGRTAAFPLDPTSPEIARWIAWPGFAKLWSQLVRWAIREETPWETRQTVRYEEGRAVLEVQTFDDSEEAALVAQVFTAPESSLDLQLVPVAPRLFRAPLPPLPPGRYGILLTRRSGEKTITQKRDVLTIDAALDDEGSAELARKLPDLELLREIAAETGGTVNGALAELTARQGKTRPVRRSLEWLMIPLALVLLLGDISVRRRLEP